MKNTVLSPATVLIVNRIAGDPWVDRLHTSNESDYKPRGMRSSRDKLFSCFLISIELQRSVRIVSLAAFASCFALQLTIIITDLINIVTFIDIELELDFLIKY